MLPVVTANSKFQTFQKTRKRKKIIYICNIQNAILSLHAYINRLNPTVTHRALRATPAEAASLVKEVQFCLYVCTYVRTYVRAL